MVGLVQKCPTCGVDDQVAKYFDLKDNNDHGFELQHPQQAYQIHAIHFDTYWQSHDAGARTMHPVERVDTGECRLTNNLPDNAVPPCAKATPTKVEVEAEAKHGNAKTLNSRIITRPLDGVGITAGPIRHDAVLIREGSDFYIVERVGPSGATNDAKMRKVVPQEQIFDMRFGPGSNSAPRLVDELDPDLKRNIFYTYAGNSLGDRGDDNFIFLSPHPEVRFSDEEQRDSSSHTSSWATDEDILRIKLKTDKGETEEWVTRTTVDHWTSGRSVQDYFREMHDYAERNPYSLGQSDCQDFAQHSNNLNGIKNRPRGLAEALAYSGSKFIPKASLPAGERPAQEPLQDTTPTQISVERFFMDPHQPGKAASGPLPDTTPHMNLQFQDLPSHGEPGLGGSATSSFSASKPSPCPDQEANSHGRHIRSKKAKAGMGVGTRATLGAVVGGGAASLTVGGVPFTLTAGVSLTTGAPYLAIACGNPVVGLAMFGGMVLAMAVLGSGSEEED